MMSHTASAPVIVVDVQTAMIDASIGQPIHNAAAFAKRVRLVLEWARRSGRPIAFIRHDGPPGDDLAPGKPGWPIWPGLEQSDTEPTFSKTVGNAFSEPALGEWIRARGAREVVLVGAETENCIASTIEGALASGLAVTVVGDAHSTWGSDRRNESADQMIARHNALFAAAGARVVSTDLLTTT